MTGGCTGTYAVGSRSYSTAKTARSGSNGSVRKSLGMRASAAPTAPRKPWKSSTPTRSPSDSVNTRPAMSTGRSPISPLPSSLVHQPTLSPSDPSARSVHLPCLLGVVLLEDALPHRLLAVRDELLARELVHVR